MHYRAIVRILGLLIALFSVTMIPPAVVSLIYQDGSGLPFTLAFFICVGGGMVLWYPNRQQKNDLRAREGFLIVALFWSVLARDRKSTRLNSSHRYHLVCRLLLEKKK